MKRYFFILAMMIAFIGCTKEGIVGPQGPDGPGGDPGAVGSGTGSGGGSVDIRSVISESPASFSWVQFSGGPWSYTYILKWKIPASSYLADDFVLPQDFIEGETNSKLLLYASEGQTGDAHKWRQLPFTDAGFGNLSTYRYHMEKQGGVFTITIFADRLIFDGTSTPQPSIKMNAIKVISLPNGEELADPFLSY